MDDAGPMPHAPGPHAASTPRPVHRLRLDRSLVLLIDVQAKLLPVIDQKTTVLRRCMRMLAGARALGVPLAITEQYPRGLGRTVPELADHIPDAAATAEKMRFSAWVPQVRAVAAARGVESVVLVGIEAHVCVQQTALDVVEAGLTPVLCLDAVGSRRAIDRQAGVHRMTHAGALTATVESVLMEWCETADSKRFRAVQEIIKSD